MQYNRKEGDKVSRANEIYPYPRLIENILGRIKQDKFNSEIIHKYYDARVAGGISNARTHKCLCTLRVLSMMLGKPFENATKDDFVKLVADIEKKNLSDWAKRDYKVILKHFYKWMRNWEDGMPPEVRWIKKTTNAENKYPILPKDLLTNDEKRALLNAAIHPRDRAMLEVFFESGRRMGEILTLHIGNIHFDDVGAKLFIHGKVGEDFARIISSAPALKMWIENHPMKDNPDAPVWIGLKNRNRMKQMAYSAATQLLKNLAKKAGVKKRVFFYLFRHTRIDESLGLLTEAQQCMMFGWRFGSKMPGTYMKRSAKHIDSAQSIMNGLKPDQKIAEIQKPQFCIFCKTENSSISKFCCRCGKSLDTKFGVEVDDRENKIKNMLHTLLTDPQELENLRKYLSEKHQGKSASQTT